MNVGGYSATGPRGANEDNCYAVDFSDVKSFTNGTASFVMVSDGMGGYQGGDVASALVVSTAKRYIDQLLALAKDHQLDFDAPYALGEICQSAHGAILREARERGGASMGATFIGAFLSPTRAWIGHVGDSRAYLVRGTEATQLTEDHSQVGHLLSSGLITEAEAQSHPARNEIDRALGLGGATPDINEVDLLPGDAIVLCSDGVYTVLDARSIADCVSRARTAEEAAARLVKLALNKGTNDNATAVVALNTRGAEAQPTRRRAQPTSRAAAGEGAQNSRPRQRARQGADVRGGTRGAASSAQAQEVPGQYRVESYRGRTSQQGKEGTRGTRPSVRQRQSSATAFDWSALLKTWAIPIAIAAALLLIILVFVVPRCSGDAGGGTEASSSSSSQSESSSASSEEAPLRASTNYEVDQGATLKYIDNKPSSGSQDEGTAHTFDEAVDSDGLGIQTRVSLKPGSTVTGDSDSHSFGQERTYIALRDSYRDDLMQDCEGYRSSGAEFQPESELSQKVSDSDEYLAFLEELVSYDDNADSGKTLEDVVYRLVVNEDSLKQE